MPARSLREQQRAERDARIFEASNHGAKAIEIVEAEGCSLRTVRRVLAAAREHGATIGETPAPPAPPQIGDAVAFEVSANHELIQSVNLHGWGIEQMRTVARRTRSDALRIGAVKAAAQLSRERLGMLSELGLLPVTRTDWSADASFRVVFAALKRDAEDAGLDWESAFARARQVWDENVRGEPRIRVADEDQAVAA
jgi:hypothetical protein